MRIFARSTFLPVSSSITFTNPRNVELRSCLSGRRSFRERLRADLRLVLNAPAHQSRVRTLKSLEAYDVADREIFAGRSRTIDKIFAEITRIDQEADEPTAALIVGASGAGKSSVLRAGVIAEAAAGLRNSLSCLYRTCLVTPRQLGAAPMEAITRKLADIDVFP
jgi:predicted AAA+ superfamily ATPase